MWLLGALTCSGPAAAAVTESDFLGDLPVVLSVSRLSQPVDEAPAAVTVIDQDMIRASGFRDIPDLLRLVPGFSVAYTRDNTWAVGYHGMADAFSRRLQVLVDGRSIYSAAFGAVQWQELPLALDDIERIEVVRGPNAATFGANAFFAVINIITKHAAQVPGTFVSAQYGEQGMSGLTLRHGGGGPDLSYRLTFSTQKRDRFETDTLDDTTPGKLFEASRTSLLNGRLDYRLSATDELSAQFGVSVGAWRAGRESSSPTSYALEPREQDVGSQYAQIRFRRQQAEGDEWSLQFYHRRHSFDAASQASLMGQLIIGDQDVLQTRTSLEFQANQRLGPELRAAWGAELRRETVRSPLYFDTADTLDSVLARVNANLEWRASSRWLFHGGAMLEHHAHAGLDVSPRIAANYRLAPGHTLRVNVSQAYRTPTFLEREGYSVYRTASGQAVDVIGFGRRDLRPERIRSHEIGYVGQYQPARMQVDAKLFYDKVTRYIGSDSVSLAPGTELVSGAGSGSARQSFNSGSFVVRGGDVQLDFQPTRALRLSAQYARVFISVSDDSVDEDLPKSAPRNTFSLLARYSLGHGWDASLGVYRSGRMKWLGDGDTTQAFTRVDVRLARRWTWQGHAMEAAIVGQNLGNDYQEFRETNVFSQRVYGSLSVGW
ncbi:MAG: TonB-dependent receptor plug domain-containing protein [Gammaproteobacteria bacterium]